MSLDVDSWQFLQALQADNHSLRREKLPRFYLRYGPSLLLQIFLVSWREHLFNFLPAAFYSRLLGYGPPQLSGVWARGLCLSEVSEISTFYPVRSLWLLWMWPQQNWVILLTREFPAALAMQHACTSGQSHQHSKILIPQSAQSLKPQSLNLKNIRP